MVFSTGTRMLWIRARLTSILKIVIDINIEMCAGESSGAGFKRN